MNYVWKFGDGQTLTTKSKNVQHTYQDLLSRDITVLLVDKDSNFIAYYSTVLNDRSFSNLTYYISNRMAQITLETIVSSENLDVTYVWSFGDGTKGSSTVPTINHTYANEGIYNVSVNVYDVYGHLIYNETILLLRDQSSSSLTSPAVWPDGSSGVSHIIESLSPTAKVGFIYEYYSSDRGTCYVKNFEYFQDTVIARLYNCTFYDVLP
jgi:PKD repeat protein